MQQQQQNEPFEKISIAKAITLLSVRIGRLELSMDKYRGDMGAGGASDDVLQAFSQRLTDAEAAQTSADDASIEQMNLVKQSVMSLKTAMSALVKDKEFKKTMVEVRGDLKKIRADVDCLTQSALMAGVEEEEEDEEVAEEVNTEEASTEEAAEEAVVEEASTEEAAEVEIEEGA
jgi:hypothetical protein